jgi:biotin-(acetyl-CoA carboxylase) ligase
MARRLQLQRERETSLRQEDEAYDPEDYDMEVLDEFERRKRKLRSETGQRRREEYFKLSKPNDDWLPIKNPKPMDDEPWFTG